MRVRFSPSVHYSPLTSVGRFLFLDTFQQFPHFHNLSDFINIYRKIGQNWERTGRGVILGIFDDEILEK